LNVCFGSFPDIHLKLPWHTHKLPLWAKPVISETHNDLISYGAIAAANSPMTPPAG
jgi:hypothetical protein